MTRSRTRTLPTWLAAAVCLTPAAAPADGPGGGLIVVRRCEIEYERSTSIGAPLVSVVQDCSVKPGDRVKAGQVLGHLLDRDARADFDMKRAAAESVIQINTADVKHKLALVLFRRIHRLDQRDLVSKEEYDVRKSALNQAALDLDFAKYTRDLAVIEARMAEARLLQRQLTSPHDGVVVDVLRFPGESVALLEPILRVVKDDRLKVTGHVDVSNAWKVRQGCPVRVYPEVDGADLDVEREAFDGTIIFVDARIDPETRTCKVVADVENRGLKLRAGLESRMEIFLGPAAQPPKGLRPPGGPRAVGRARNADAPPTVR